MTRRRRACTAFGALLCAAVFAAGGCTTGDQAAVKAAPRITDASWRASASGACEDAVHVFDTTATLGKTPTRAESADLLTHIEATFETMVSRVRALPVASPDRPAVASWLADWDTYLAEGRTYAAAVRDGGEGPLTHGSFATSEGAVRRRLRAFAEANHMPACVFP